uniref:Uncharacterized protein n=1 Tax=viral metagenome TaxID=1070528 RepID=A0A6M3KFC6_9ZZZZ
MLTGEAKKEYQRKYMKSKRSNNAHDPTGGSNKYPKTDYRYWLTPPEADKIPADYVKQFWSLPVDVQIVILETISFKEEDDDQVIERVTRAVGYQEWLKKRVLGKPILEAVR